MNPAKDQVEASVFIVGTNHHLQCGSCKVDKELIEAFSDEILKICRDHEINSIFEEMSSDGLKSYGVEETVCQILGVNKSIEVELIDLGSDERRCICIDDWMRDKKCRQAFEEWFQGDSETDSTLETSLSDADVALINEFNNLAYEVRERVWVARILKKETWPLLFICGANHVVSVSRLLHRFGVNTEIVHHDFNGQQHQT